MEDDVARSERERGGRATLPETFASFPRLLQREVSASSFHRPFPLLLRLGVAALPIHSCEAKAARKRRREREGTKWNESERA